MGGHLEALIGRMSCGGGGFETLSGILLGEIEIILEGEIVGREGMYNKSGDLKSLVTREGLSSHVGGAVMLHCLGGLIYYGWGIEAISESVFGFWR